MAGQTTQDLIDYLFKLNKDSTDKWELTFLSMLQANEESLLEISIDEHIQLSDYVLSTILDVGCEDKNTLKRILSICCDGCMDFRDIPMNPVELTNTAFLFVDVLLMKVLVKYGFVDTALKEDAAEFKRAEKDIEEFRCFAVEKNWLCIGNNEEEEEFSNLHAIMKIMKDMSSGCLQRSIFQGGVRRILLLTRLIRVFPAVRDGGEWNLLQHAHCFKLFFTVLPDPFISSDELLAFLQIIFNRRMSIEGQKSIVAKYKEYFALEASSPYQPRSLKHLCRVSVREEYRKRSETLPVLFKRMCIPETLKDFLLGECEV